MQSAIASAAGAVRNWAKRLKRDAITLWFAYRHPRTPILIKAWCFFTVAYALSPIDLVPDFIPVLGYLDELILLPVMIWIALRFMPEPITAACRIDAERWMEQDKSKPKSYFGAALVVAVWIAAIAGCWYLLRAL